MSIRKYFENIADAIKDKNPNVTNVTPAEMPSAIRSIPSGSSTASGVSYDNTASGLTANNVQDAIDELAEDVTTINSDLSELHILVDNVKYTAATSAIEFNNSYNHYKIYLRDANGRVGMSDYYPNIGNSLSLMLVAMFDSNGLRNEVRIENTNGKLTYKVITISTYCTQYGVRVTIVGLDTV